MDTDRLAERQAAYTERLAQEAIPDEPEEEQPPPRVRFDEHDRHRCVMVDPTDPWSEAACERPW